MNAGYSPTDFGPDGMLADLTGLLREAVVEIRQTPPSEKRMTALLNVAARWAAEQTTRPSLRTAALVAAAIALVTLGAGVFGFWLANPRISFDHQTKVAQARQEPGPMQNVDKPQDIQAGATPTVAASGLPSADRDGAEPVSSPPPRGAVAQGFGAAGASPSRWLSVAHEATVIVSTGANKPIKLGEQQPYSRAHQLHVWDWSSGGESRPLNVEHGGGFAVSPDGKTIITTDGRAIETETGKSRRLEHFDTDVRKVQFSRDGKTLVLQIGHGDHATIRLLNSPAGTKRVDIEDQFVYMFGVDFTSDGREVVVMNKDMSIRRFDSSQAVELMKYSPPHTNSIRAIAISPNGELLASAGPRGEVFLWELKTGKLIGKPSTRYPNSTYDDQVYSLAFSPDGKLLAGGAAQQLVLWNTSNGEMEHIYGRDSGGAEHIRFSKDAKELTTVRGFYGTRDEAGRDLLVYPAVTSWKVETKN
jgi:hypothetical protein